MGYWFMLDIEFEIKLPLIVPIVGRFAKLGGAKNDVDCRYEANSCVLCGALFNAPDVEAFRSALYPTCNGVRVRSCIATFPVSAANIALSVVC